tara:strand:+ start:3115 stop:3897 length:783 start_codon:yes stop_codon:yes gene_type:complete
MATVPRVCDTLEIERIANEPAEYAIRNRQGEELGKVTEEGYYLLLQLDGISTLNAIRERLKERFGKSSSAADLESWFAELGQAGVLNTNERALRILTYLREQGISYRGSSADRRGSKDTPLTDRREEGRRDQASAAAAWFDYGIFLLNDGMLEQGVDVFERLSQSQQGDVRIHEIISHLRFLTKSEDVPDLSEDRRDVSWEAFDAALREMLDQGACPRCDLPIEIELGATNRCHYCGASFSSYVLGRAGQDRRQGKPAAD